MRRMKIRLMPQKARTALFVLGIATFLPKAALAQAGYVLDGFGGVHAYGGAATITPSTTYFGFDVAESIELIADGSGYYVLDAFGGVHPGGTATVPTPAPPYFGFDVARDIALVPTPPPAPGIGTIVAFGSFLHHGQNSSCTLAGPNSSNVSVVWDATARSCDVSFSDFTFDFNTHGAVVSGVGPLVFYGHRPGDGEFLRITARHVDGSDPNAGRIVQFIVFQ